MRLIHRHSPAGGAEGGSGTRPAHRWVSGLVGILAAALFTLVALGKLVSLLVLQTTGIEVPATVVHVHSGSGRSDSSYVVVEFMTLEGRPVTAKVDDYQWRPIPKSGDLARVVYAPGDTTNVRDARMAEPADYFMGYGLVAFMIMMALVFGGVGVHLLGGRGPVNGREARWERRRAIEELDRLGMILWSLNADSGRHALVVEPSRDARENDSPAALVVHPLDDGKVVYLLPGGRFGVGELDTDNDRIITSCRRPDCRPDRCRRSHLELATAAAAQHIYEHISARSPELGARERWKEVPRRVTAYAVRRGHLG